MAESYIKTSIENNTAKKETNVDLYFKLTSCEGGMVFPLNSVSQFGFHKDCLLMLCPIVSLTN